MARSDAEAVSQVQDLFSRRSCPRHKVKHDLTSSAKREDNASRDSGAFAEGFKETNRGLTRGPHRINNARLNLRCEAGEIRAGGLRLLARARHRRAKPLDFLFEFVNCGATGHGPRIDLCNAVNKLLKLIDALRLELEE